MRLRSTVQAAAGGGQWALNVRAVETNPRQGRVYRHFSIGFLFPNPARALPERSLGAGDTWHSWVGFDGDAERAGGTFKDRLADVVAVSAVVQDDVQIAQGVGRHRLPKVFD